MLRNNFAAGLLVLVPIVLTVKALQWLFTFVDDLAQPLAQAFAGRPIPGFGFLLTLAIVFLAGVAFSHGPLHRVLEGIEGLLSAVPLVGAVYGTTKKVISGFGSPEPGRKFRKFVFARLRGRTTPGFLMGSFTLRQADGRTTTLCTVYVPTNHLYVGDVVVLPPEDVLETDMAVDDGVSLILSAGASMPLHVAEAGSTTSTTPGPGTDSGGP